MSCVIPAAIFVCAIITVLILSNRIDSEQAKHYNSDKFMITRTSDAIKETVPSLLFMIASYSLDQYISLQKAVDCLRDICNSGWDVTIHMQVSNGLHSDHPSFIPIAERLFCIRTNSRIPVVIEQYEKIGFGLNSKHRGYAAAHIEEFDYFAYAEEDMILTVSHLSAYVTATNKLKAALPAVETAVRLHDEIFNYSRHDSDSWLNYQIGFLRLQ